MSSQCLVEPSTDLTRVAPDLVSETQQTFIHVSNAAGSLSTPGINLDTDDSSTRVTDRSKNDRVDNLVASIVQPDPLPTPSSPLSFVKTPESEPYLRSQVPVVEAPSPCASPMSASCESGPLSPRASPRSRSPSPCAPLLLPSIEVDPSHSGLSTLARNRILPSSQESSHSSGSDLTSQGTRARESAKLALSQIEVSRKTQVSSKHRNAMVENVLALGEMDSLRNLGEACTYWREEYHSKLLQFTAPALAHTGGHPSLERFCRAYHNTTKTTLHRAMLNIVSRLELAQLHDLYLETVRALTHYASQANPGLALECLDSEASDEIKNQIFWACYPLYQGKPRSSMPGLQQNFQLRMLHAKKWHTLQSQFSIGLLALMPPKANSWFSYLSLKELDVYIDLVRDVNPIAVSMGERVSEQVFVLWKGEEDPPAQMLRLEHLENFDSNLRIQDRQQLVDPVDLGCILHYPSYQENLQEGRALTLPAGLDENNYSFVNNMFLDLSPML